MLESELTPTYSHTIESMLKELKSNLNKFETLLVKLEKSQLFTKGTHLTFISEELAMKPDLNEIEKIKNEIDRNIKNISSVVNKNEHKFMLNKYKEIKEQLNQRNKIFIKSLNKASDNKKMEELMTNKNGLNGTKGVDMLNEENQSLNTCIRISEDLKKIGMNAEEELEMQEKTLKKNLDKVGLILNKIPGLNKIMSSINFHKYKEKIVLGLVIGFVVVLGLYLTYY